MKDRTILISKAIFIILIGIFLLLMSYFAFPASPYIKQRIFPIVAILAINFFLLGIALIFISRKVKGRLKVILIITGVATAGFLVSILLHNLIYGLLIKVFGAGFWENIGLRDEPFFFLTALIGFPIVFVIGIICSIIAFIKRAEKD